MCAYFKFLTRISSSIVAFALISQFAFAAQNSDKESQIPVNPDGLVEVEPSYFEYTKSESRYELVPYTERRGKWSSQFSVGYSTYTPVDYASEYSALSFEDAYGFESDLPLIEVQYIFKRNFSFGSLGAELGVGMYENKSDIESLSSTLKLYPIRLGAVLSLDGIFKNPYIVPYVAGGAYTIVFEENKDGGTDAYGGNTQVAPYATAGVSFSIDWLDPEASRTGFEENGVQGTFIYVEGRIFFASAAARDRDFENGFDPNAGLRIEF
ncbi:hypothetical protein GW915_01010 [bacterium]|nr:hypothetical protein [bacterium]